MGFCEDPALQIEFSGALSESKTGNEIFQSLSDHTKDWSGCL